MYIHALEEMDQSDLHTRGIFCLTTQNMGQRHQFTDTVMSLNTY